MEKEDFTQDNDIDILAVTKMDTESKPEASGEPLTESADSTIAAMMSSEAMREMFA